MQLPIEVEVYRSELSPELRKVACSEALSLWHEDRIDEFDEMGFRVMEQVPDDPSRASFFGVACYDPDQEAYDASTVAFRLSWMYTEFPALSETLQVLCDLPTRLGETTSSFASSFTINYYSPTQTTERHQDLGEKNFDRIARVANVLGSGATWFSSEENGDYNPIESCEGDIISFYNPSHEPARPWHFGEGYKYGMRISIGLQLRSKL